MYIITFPSRHDECSFYAKHCHLLLLNWKFGNDSKFGCKLNIHILYGMAYVMCALEIAIFQWVFLSFWSCATDNVITKIYVNIIIHTFSSKWRRWGEKRKFLGHPQSKIEKFHCKFFPCNDQKLKQWNEGLWNRFM